jgi:type I restriction enzyme, R subunit
MVKELSAAFALAVPRQETEAVVEHLAFFQRVQAMIRKRLADDSGSNGRGRRDVDYAMRQIMGDAVDADDGRRSLCCCRIRRGPARRIER